MGTRRAIHCATLQPAHSKGLNIHYHLIARHEVIFVACQMSTLTFWGSHNHDQDWWWSDHLCRTGAGASQCQSSANRGHHRAMFELHTALFPKSTIILSTWKGQPLDGLDYDQVLELDDPGANTVFMTASQLNSIITVRCTAPTWGWKR